jgi:biopolymer transport protein TolR
MEVNRQTRRKPMAEINVVPMIDVMLVLLIVFMISTPLITQGIKVDLPKVNAETVEESDEPTLVVSINAAGEYFISLGEVSEDNPVPVPLEQIGDNVKKIMSANPKVPVFVEADSSIPYGTVMKLGGTLSAAGVAELRFITQPPGIDSDK